MVVAVMVAEEQRAMQGVVWSMWRWWLLLRRRWRWRRRRGVVVA
jgi:hypothetical protein